MPTTTTDQGITRPIDADSADNPVAFINELSGLEPRLVRTYTNEADRTAKMVSLAENNLSGLAAENRVEVYDGTNHISLFTRSLWADQFRTTDAAAVNNSVVLVSDSVLVTALPTAGRFQFDLTLFYDTAAAADIKIAFTWPAGATARWSGHGPATTVAASVGDGQWGSVIASAGAISYGGSGVGTANTHMVIIRGSILMGGTAGNLQTQYAQATADPSNTIVRADSRLMVWRVA